MPGKKALPSNVSVRFFSLTVFENTYRKKPGKPSVFSKTGEKPVYRQGWARLQIL